MTGRAYPGRVSETPSDRLTEPPATRGGQPEPWTDVVPPPPPAPRRRHTGVIVLACLLVLALAAGGVLTWRLLVINRAWQEHSQDWQQLSEQTGAELGQTRAELETARVELAAVSDQLAAAQERITQLADEKAQLGDESAAQQQLVDYQARVSAAAGQVATALKTCIDGQEKLIGYMAAPEGTYNPDDVAAFRSDVESYCRNASDANAKLQAELSR